MTQQDLLFLALALIVLVVLTLIAIRLLRDDRKDDGGEWYQGRWKDDDRSQGR